MNVFRGWFLLCVLVVIAPQQALHAAGPQATQATSVPGGGNSLKLDEAERADGSNADARIRYYKSKLRGAWSYPAQARLGLAYLEKARESGESEYYEKALEHLHGSLKKQENFEALLGLALAYIERHEFPKALAYAEQAVVAMAGNVDAQGALFDSLLALGKLDRAAEVVQRMMELKPGFAALTRQAALRSYRGDLRGAVEAMQRACEHAAAARLAASTRAWAYVRLGSLQIAACEAAPAAQCYQNALTLYPGYFLALEHLAELHAAEGRSSEAMRIYRELLERIPEPKYRLALAELYTSEGQHSKARKEERKALAGLRKAVAAGSKAELRELALQLLGCDGDAREGLRLAERDWENRQDATAADTLAWAYFRNGAIEKALKFAQKAVGGGTRDPQILLHAGVIHHHAGRPKEARSFIMQARECRLNLSGEERRLAESVWAELNRTAARP